MKKQKVDNQLIELAGRNWLMSQLIQGQIEVARPERDRGVDLIAYIEKPKFLAVRIQMKAFTNSGFAVYREKYRGMLLVYVWNLQVSSKTVAFALTCREALKVFKKMGWKSDGVWMQKATWFVNSPDPEGRLVKLLSEHRMTPHKWRTKIRQVALSGHLKTGH